ncbi:unnamed protein product [Pleuronectes platessa]|uniref:Uncharacterized protein n=1 Tax=Pleuronectes platessa TaxID=8262 RepID=A0A9N7UZ09_PLEPL|nr:unnamed protein product [Pleuronectes platessa]
MTDPARGEMGWRWGKESLHCVPVVARLLSAALAHCAPPEQPARAIAEFRGGTRRFLLFLLTVPDGVGGLPRGQTESCNQAGLRSARAQGELDSERVAAPRTRDLLLPPGLPLLQ